MKGFVVLFCGLFVLGSCATQRRIEQSGKKSRNSNEFRFIQVSASTTGTEKSRASFLFSLSDSDRPEMSIQIKPSQRVKENITENRLALLLDHEQIQLSPTGQSLESERFLVPDNLWIPLVYSRDVAFKIQSGKEEVTFIFNRKNQNRLTEFFLRAVHRYSLDKPVIPSGKKKW